MALSHFFFTVSLLLFSLLLVVSAGDYAYNTKPSGDNQDSKSQTNYSFNLKADLGKSKSESHDYGYKPEAPKPKPEGGDYNTKPKSEEKPKSESHDYIPIPKSEHKPKSESHEYIPIPKPDVYKPKPHDHGYEKPLPISVEGVILCKSGSEYYPIQGAVAKVTCLVDDIYGSKTTVYSISSKATDSKGYFLTDLCSLKLSDNLKLKQCKVFLDNSPLKDCNIPTDVNRGITGALLNSYRILNEKKIKLYSVRPFFFTSGTKSIPKGY